MVGGRTRLGGYSLCLAIAAALGVALAGGTNPKNVGKRGCWMSVHAVMVCFCEGGGQ